MRDKPTRKNGLWRKNTTPQSTREDCRSVSCFVFRCSCSPRDSGDRRPQHTCRRRGSDAFGRLFRDCTFYSGLPQPFLHRRWQRTRDPPATSAQRKTSSTRCMRTPPPPSHRDQMSVSANGGRRRRRRLCSRREREPLAIRTAAMATRGASSSTRRLAQVSFLNFATTAALASLDFSFRLVQRYDMCNYDGLGRLLLDLPEAAALTWALCHRLKS